MNMFAALKQTTANFTSRFQLQNFFVCCKFTSSDYEMIKSLTTTLHKTVDRHNTRETLQ